MWVDVEVSRLKHNLLGHSTSSYVTDEIVVMNILK